MNTDVRACTVAYNGRTNVLKSKAWISVAFDPKKSDPPPNIEFDAIWDTGASASVISKNVVTKCGLQPTGMVEVHTAGGQRTRNSYLVCISLPNKVGFPTVKVTEGKINEADVLIGMDLIGLGDFSVSNYQGKTVFSYRIPSVDRTDFVKEINKAKQQKSGKIGRNAPCPCGSGKKYKKCCGA